MPLEPTGQAEWGGGIYRGRKAPPDCVYDALNALIDDEGNLFRRGGSAYVTTSNAGEDLFSLKASYYPAPSAMRTLAFGVANHYVVNGTGFLTLGHDGGGPYPPPRGSRISAAGKIVVWPAVAAGPTLLTAAYGGSLKASQYLTGTVAVTNGSATVTGSGTTWASNVDAGMFMDIAGADRYYVVKSVGSNTSITLDEPWQGSTGSGVSYAARPVSIGSGYSAIFQPSVSGDAVPYVAYVGRRVLYAYGTRVAFGTIDAPGLQGANDYHELPGDAFIVGLDGIGDTAIVFTTEGVWSIGNLFFDPVDDAGNVQHIVGKINRDVILWGDPGVASWAGGLVVPAIDDVHLIALGGESRPISQAIRPLYRSYVKAGYQPGLGSVHRGTYFLPVMNGSTLVDVLVCRLDSEGTPWTRWAGHAAGGAYAQEIGAAARSPRLLGIAGQRVTNLTSCFDSTGANSSDADGTAHPCTIVTRDYPTSGSNHPGTVARLRLRYSMVSADVSAQVLLSYSSDQDGGTLAPLNDSGEEGTENQGGLPASGARYSWWRVGKRRERIRFQILTTGVVSSFVLRSVELLIRQSGLR